MRTFLPFLGLIVALGVVSPAQALEVHVSQDGDTTVVKSSVLGVNTQVETQQTIRKSEQATVRVQSDERVRVEVRNNQDHAIVESEGDEVRVQFPAGRSAEQEQAQQVREEARLRAEELRQEAAQVRENASAAAQEIRAQARELRAEHREYIEQVQEERRARMQEIVELRNKQLAEGKAAIELQSRNVRATLQGAEFTLDPATQTISLTTPAGQVHELTHLPDQAIARMTESGFFGVRQPQGSLELRLSEAGTPVYTAVSEKQKRFLWLFERSVPSQVELDDTTGEVIERELPADSFLSRVANSLTF